MKQIKKKNNMNKCHLKSRLFAHFLFSFNALMFYDSNSLTGCFCFCSAECRLFNTELEGEGLSWLVYV